MVAVISKRTSKNLELSRILTWMMLSRSRKRRREFLQVRFKTSHTPPL